MLYLRNTNSQMKSIPMVKSILLFTLALFVTVFGFSQSRTLDYYISTGLDHSPLLNDFTNQLQSGSLDSLLSLAGYKPQVSISSQALYAPAGTNFGYDQAITNGGNYATSIGVKQSLFNSKISLKSVTQFHKMTQELLKNSMSVM